MGSGAPATRAVAQVVLLDGRFANMPSVVAEGRRVIANVERVANLFVTKTFYAMLLAIAIGIARWPYPFLPRHLTIVSSLTIGIPAFFLALAPNRRRYVPGFVKRVLFLAGPAGAVAAAATFAVVRRRPSLRRTSGLAHRGDDHAPRRRALGAEPARPPDHARAVVALPRDGRRVRADPRRAEAPRLVRARPPERPVDVGGGSRRRGRGRRARARLATAAVAHAARRTHGPVGLARRAAPILSPERATCGSFSSAVSRSRGGRRGRPKVSRSLSTGSRRSTDARSSRSATSIRWPSSRRRPRLG